MMRKEFVLAAALAGVPGCVSEPEQPETIEPEQPEVIEPAEPPTIDLGDVVGTIDDVLVPHFIGQPEAFEAYKQHIFDTSSEEVQGELESVFAIAGKIINGTPDPGSARTEVGPVYHDTPHENLPEDYVPGEDPCPQCSQFVLDPTHSNAANFIADGMIGNIEIAWQREGEEAAREAFAQTMKETATLLEITERVQTDKQYLPYTNYAYGRALRIAEEYLEALARGENPEPPTVVTGVENEGAVKETNGVERE